MLCISEFMHFYGYKHHEVMGLENVLFEELFYSMVKNKARDRLVSMDNLIYPKMNDDNRKKLHKMVYEKSQTEESIAQAILKTSNALGDFGVIKESHGRRK